MPTWKRWHARRWWLRVPIKFALFLAGLWLVLYPLPWLLPQNVQRARALPALIDPAEPRLASLEIDAYVLLAAEPHLQPQQAVERVVYEHLPYAWDWDNWGVMDYLPTVAEALDRGREDCDGRAIVAASLLRRMGYEAELVSDFLHMWVATPREELMSPGAGAQSIRSVDGEVELAFNPSMATNFFRGLAYGIAVFPLPRQVVLLLLAIVLTLHPRIGFWRSAAGVLLLWVGFDLVRDTGLYAAQVGAWQSELTAAAGFGLIALGWLVLAIKGRAAADAPPAPLPE